MIITMLYLIIAGFTAGIISGMGLGGGIILIPVLTLLLDFEQKTAQGMTLFFFIPTALFALTVHFKNKMIKHKTSAKISLGGVIGASLGAYLAIRFQPDTLRIIFGVFLAIIGFYQLRQARRAQL